MKIHQIMQIEGKDTPIVSLALTLDRDAPGRAIAAIQSPDTVVGNVAVLAGINGVVSPYFSGYIEQCVRVDGKQQRLVIRETPSLLDRRAPIARRNSKLAEILAELSRLSGVQFRTSGNWTERSAPHFVNLGTGWEALRLIGQLSGLDDFVTLSQPDGSLFAGPAGALKRCRTVLRLDARIFTNLSATGAECAFLPALRPGMRIRIGDSAEQTITQVTMTGEKLRLGFDYA